MLSAMRNKQLYADRSVMLLSKRLKKHAAKEIVETIYSDYVDFGGFLCLTL